MVPFCLSIVLLCEGDKEVSWIAQAKNHPLLILFFQPIHKYSTNTHMRSTESLSTLSSSVVDAKAVEMNIIQPSFTSAPWGWGRGREREGGRESEGEIIFLRAMRADFSKEVAMCSELCRGHSRQKEGHEQGQRGAERWPLV